MPGMRTSSASAEGSGSSLRGTRRASAFTRGSGTPSTFAASRNAARGPSVACVAIMATRLAPYVS